MSNTHRKITFWLDSGANIYSKRTTTVSLYDLGFDEETWDNMSDAEKEEVAREIAFERADWGWVEK